MVMHARKPQRLNDGYFEKHQTHPYQSSKYSSKRDYEREASSRSTNYIRGSDRDLSPNSSVPSGALNNGNSYRSDSPDLDSPRESRDRSDRYQSSSYIQKIKDRGRNDYKKDKYSLDKRDRRDRDAEHRTNHDRIEMSSSSRRSSKLMYQPSDKRSGSDDRDRDRSERDIRDRERDHRGGGSNSNSGNDRERDRLNRMCDWSEHVSSSGKKYYYNCKTEVSQWEKPKEWLEKERNLSKEQHRDYRDKERDRDREERFSRSSYAKHSSSRNSRLRWPHDSENVQSHRRRNEVDSQDMDISPGDSTPTSEASYSHSSTPNAQPQAIVDGPVLLANARLASHPSTPTNSQLHFSSSSVINTSTSCTVSSSSGNDHFKMIRESSLAFSHRSDLNSSSSSSKLNKGTEINSNLPTSSPSTTHLHSGNISSNSNSSNNSNSNNHSSTGQHNSASLTSSSSSLPPTSSSSKKNQLINSGSHDKSAHNDVVQKSQLSNCGSHEKTLHNDSIQLQQPLQQQHSSTASAGLADGINQIANNNCNSSSLREHALNSPLYNLPHNLSHSMLNHANISGSNNGGSSVQYVQSNAQTGMISTQQSTLGIGISSQFSAAGLKADGSSTLLVGDGPPTPTQELDMTSDHRKLDGASASLSSLQGVVTSSQILRHQGPSLTPSLANYIRADLIAHVTNWPAEILEKQAQVSSDEATIIGDLQCTKVSADLKSARSVVRITEITATLQEQKVMYLRQQIRRLEELKSQNSFMSEDL